MRQLHTHAAEMLSWESLAPYREERGRLEEEIADA